MFTFAIKEKRLLKKIAQKYSLELILLFGSQVSKKTHKESDYDIAYLSKNSLDISEEGQLMLKLAPLLRIPLEEMELVSLRNTSPLFLKEVFSNAEVIYAEDNLIFDRYKIYAYRLFEESKPIFENMEKILKRKVERYKQEITTRVKK